MKNLTCAVLLGTFAFVSPLYSTEDLDSVSLTSESRNAVMLATLGGGIAGLGSYIGFHILTNFSLPTLSKHPYATAFFTVAGAATAGIWKYQHTPEVHFNFAKSELLRIASNGLFGLVVNVEPSKLVATLKDHYFREKLPLYVAFKQLYNMSVTIDQSKDSLNTVLASHRDDLHKESVELQVLADMYLVILKDVFKTLKEDQNFINECNAGTLELIKEAQEAAAHAAQSSAFTQQMAYMSSLHQTHNVSVNIAA